MCKTDKENYEKYWDDISPFIKFGCLKDEKFCDKMSDYILFKNIDHKYLTLKECVEENGGSLEAAKDAKEEVKEEDKTVIYYVTDEQQQSQYINMFREEKLDAVLLTHNIDSAFISQLEQRNQGIKFQRIDADLTNTFKEEIAKEDEEAIQKQAEEIKSVFQKALNNDKLNVMMTISEENRRMQEMMKMYNMYGMDANMFAPELTLTLNANHPLVKYVLEHQDGEHTNLFCEQLYDLAVLSNQPLSPEAMTKFVARSNEIMMLLAK